MNVFFYNTTLHLKTLCILLVLFLFKSCQVKRTVLNLKRSGAIEFQHRLCCFQLCFQLCLFNRREIGLFKHCNFKVICLPDERKTNSVLLSMRFIYQAVKSFILLLR